MILSRFRMAVVLCSILHAGLSAVSVLLVLPLVCQDHLYIRVNYWHITSFTPIWGHQSLWVLLIRLYNLLNSNLVRNYCWSKWGAHHFMVAAVLDMAFGLNLKLPKENFVSQGNSIASC
ncbi:hypothetical protein VNO78_10984 [Psophocarpus tetragonolobus]|uniref:Uncharacterized protein n=1 Tax=Psophocarpus tetragonolobus TaxID=3891 RepID=A0AAN9SL00_PSOTE